MTTNQKITTQAEMMASWHETCAREAMTDAEHAAEEAQTTIALAKEHEAKNEHSEAVIEAAGTITAAAAAREAQIRAEISQKYAKEADLIANTAKSAESYDHATDYASHARVEANRAERYAAEAFRIAAWHGIIAEA